MFGFVSKSVHEKIKIELEQANIELLNTHDSLKALHKELANKNEVLLNQDIEFRTKAQELFYQADKENEDAKRIKAEAESELLEAVLLKQKNENPALNINNSNIEGNTTDTIKSDTNAALSDKKLEYYKKAKEYFIEADIALQQAKSIKLEAEQELLSVKSLNKNNNTDDVSNELDKYSQIRRKSQKIFENAEKANENAKKLKSEADNYKSNEIKKFNNEKIKLSNELNLIKSQLNSVKNELDNVDFISAITPFKQIFQDQPSEKIKQLLELNKDKQIELVTMQEVYTITDDILWNDSLQQGKARQNRLAKFLFKSFNSEVDNLISQTKSTNFSRIVKKIESWFERVNKAGANDYIRIEREFLELRLQEHRYVFEYHLNKEMELEEQRYFKEALREEAKVKKEIEVFVKDREKEVNNYQKDINEAVSKIKLANVDEFKKLNEHIDTLKKKLELAQSEKERALSMAQLTRSGYVYVISNKGSFGEDIYKIGMTRRLEPMDRVKELSNASVPFSFDVHALIPSDDAPSLERKLHDRFSSKRVNKVNKRREYFNTSIDDIEEALYELVDEDVHLIKDIKALQYEETLLLESMEVSNGEYN
jgi:hypothetical protein